MCEMVRLGELASVKGGKRLPKGANLISTRNSHPYIRVRDLNDRHTLELTSDYEYVDDETQKTISRYTVDSGDVVLSIVGTIGLVAVVGDSLHRANLTENCVKITQLHGVDRDYLYYYLKSELGQAEIAKGTVGAVQAKLPIKNIQALNVPLPKLEKQKKISSILSALDKKIECNIKINDNLQQQAATVYLDWCSQCEDTVQIGEIVDNILDYTPCDFQEVVLINSSEVTEGHFNHHSLSKNANLKGHFKKRFKKYDILYSEIRPKNKHYAFVLFNADKYIASTRLMVIRAKKEFITPSLLYQHLSSPQVCDEFAATTETRSGTFPQGCYADFSKIEVPYMPLKQQREVTSFLDSVYMAIEHNDRENFRLTLLRNTLLPKLMSGEIDV